MLNKATESRRGGVLCQSKFVSDLCLVHVACLQSELSWLCQNCELCSLRGTSMYCICICRSAQRCFQKAWGVDVTTVSSDVSVCHMKNKLSTHLICFCFSFLWIYSRVNAGVECRENFLQGIFLTQHFSLNTKHKAQDLRPRFWYKTVQALKQKYDSKLD